MFILEGFTGTATEKSGLWIKCLTLKTPLAGTLCGQAEVSSKLNIARAGMILAIMALLMATLVAFNQAAEGSCILTKGPSKLVFSVLLASAVLGLITMASFTALVEDRNELMKALGVSDKVDIRFAWSYFVGWIGTGLTLIGCCAGWFLS